MSLNAEVSSFSNALNFHSWSLVILWFTALILIRKSLPLKIEIGLNLDNPTLLHSASFFFIDDSCAEFHAD